jgi:hypothetical protein
MVFLLCLVRGFATVPNRWEAELRKASALSVGRRCRFPWLFQLRLGASDLPLGAAKLGMREQLIKLGVCEWVVKAGFEIEPFSL